MKRWYRAAAAAAILLVMLVVAAFPVSIKMVDDGVVPVPQDRIVVPSAEITQGVTVIQRLPAPGQAISSIALFLATYNRTPHGTLQILIQIEREAEQWETVSTRLVDQAQIANNTFFNVTFEPPLQVPAARRLAVVLSSDAGPGEAITWWTSPAWTRANYQLLINGQPRDGGAILTVQYDRPSGPFLRMIPQLWSRTTVFLDPLWQVVLLGAMLVALGSLGFSQIGRFS